MAERLLIISTDSELTEQLAKALAEVEIAAEPLVLEGYPTLAQLRRAIENSATPIIGIIVGLSDEERGLALIRSSRVSHPEIVLAAADMSSSAEKILGAMRAGASEFLAPPFGLKHLVERCRAYQQPVRPAARGDLICFLPAQGGNGASTVAIHAADALAREVKGEDLERRLLLVDFDFHSGTVAFRLRLKPEFTLEDALARSDILDELWSRLVARWGGVEVLAAPPAGTTLSYEAIQRVPGMFRSALNVYSHVLVDMPTALYSSCREVLEMASQIYLVCTADAISLHLARRRVADLVDLGIPREHIKVVVNRVGSKNSLNIDDVEAVVGAPITWALPNDYSTVTEAFFKGGVVPRDSNLGKQFRRFGSVILGKEEPGKKLKTKQKGWKRFLSFR